jgi:filamentous hemagglutinin family protein
MANDKKFVARNGLQTQNIDFVSNNESNTVSIQVTDSGTLVVDGKVNVNGDINLANVTLASSSSITFGDGSQQAARAPMMFTNDSVDANGDLIMPLIPGDFYYDNTSDTLFVYTDFGGYSDFLDITVRL